MATYHLDYETRSLCDIADAGAYRYANDPSTEIFMYAIAKEDGASLLWVNPKFGSWGTSYEADELLREAVFDDDAVIYAHNAQFEAAVSKYLLQRTTQIPAPSLKKWRCTAAMARRACIPASLEQCAEYLKLGQKKDPRGKELIKFFSVPNRKGEFNDPAEYSVEFAEFCMYCLQDVRTEQGIYHKLKPFELKGPVLDAWLFDMELNDRGLPVNVPALKNTKKILDVTLHDTEEEFTRLTKFTTTQRSAVREFIGTLGLDLPNMQADTITEAKKAQEEKLEVLRKSGTMEELKAQHFLCRVLELYSTVQYAAAKKVYSMLNAACDDGYVRGTLKFHGASTGRWSGAVIQPQNYKKPTFKGTEGAYSMLCSEEHSSHIEMIYGAPLEVIASCVRHFIQPHEGSFYDADYNAVEARIVCWLAGQENMLELFRNGGKLYETMAGTIYGRRPEEILNPSRERDLGKAAVLGCGFSMGPVRFLSSCAEKGVIITPELADRAVKAYRKMCPDVVDLWRQADHAAKNAIRKPGKVFTAGEYLAFEVRNLCGIKYLCMRLPSGRNLVYPEPAIVVEPDKKDPTWIKENITFYGQDDKGKWTRISTYGGKLVENATQAVAWDIMSAGAVRASRAGFKLFTLIHDQALAASHPTLTIKDFDKILTELPQWAEGLPLKAEGKVVPFYRK